MEITAEITGISYQPTLTKSLKEVQFSTFNINDCPNSCLIVHDNQMFSLSKWVSPKRTRSYPYERIYDTFVGNKRITVIPIIKDEGNAGDRDFIQWDTISLMSLLDVYVILAYYETARKHSHLAGKVTAQHFNNQYVIQKINELQNYHSSALHWNLKELNSQNLTMLLDKAKSCYTQISQALGVQMHNELGISSLQQRLATDIGDFMMFSREKSEKAQFRELHTQQPKEHLNTLTKATITITNYLGGKYFFTVDEVYIKDDTVYLIESKHTKTKLLPSKSDIKDGLLKMVLYSNLQTAHIFDTPYRVIPVLQLTSPHISFSMNQLESPEQLDNFVRSHRMNKNQITFLMQLFEEARCNHFQVSIVHG